MERADDRILELEGKVRELEEKFNAFVTSLDEGVLGSRTRPVKEIYLQEKGLSPVARLTFEDAATPAVRVEKVR